MEQKINNYFKMINGYTPTFSSFEGSIYEMELTRAAIHSFATHVSKFRPEIKGSGNAQLERKLQFRPNKLMDTKKYLYRLATVYMVENTAFIAPLYDDRFNLAGFYPLLTEKAQIVDVNGQKFLRYDFGYGNFGSVELKKAGIMTQFQFKNELFGESNKALRPTMDLINMQNQAIVEGVKNSANLRFLAKVATALKPEDVDRERKRFISNNLSAENNGGVLLFDSKFEDVKQIDSKPFIVNPMQMAQIKENVFNYFGTNQKILQNNFNSDEWNAYYEGKLEPFAIEMSLVHTNMTFSEHEIAFGNEIIFTANRLQYLSNSEKLNTVTQLFDRGFLTHNQGLEIFNMPPIDGGDDRYIRKEYAQTDTFFFRKEEKHQKKNQFATVRHRCHFAHWAKPRGIKLETRENIGARNISGDSPQKEANNDANVKGPAIPDDQPKPQTPTETA